MSINNPENLYSFGLIDPRMTKVSWHHSGGGYIPNSSDIESYHIMFGLEGRDVPVYAGRYHAIDSINYGLPYHTYGENYNCYGLSLLSMEDASASAWSKAISKMLKDKTLRGKFNNYNFGSKFPIRWEQLEVMCRYTAFIIKYCNIPISECKTHEEWATINGYGPGSGDSETKWDLWKLGTTLRSMTQFYLKSMK